MCVSHKGVKDLHRKEGRFAYRFIARLINLIEAPLSRPKIVSSEMRVAQNF